jgi:hypothetical protein
MSNTPSSSTSNDQIVNTTSSSTLQQPISEDVKSNTPSLFKTYASNESHSIGITSKRKVLPGHLSLLASMSNDDRYDLKIAAGNTQKVNLECEIPSSDTGSDLHPILCPILQAGHQSSRIDHRQSKGDFDPGNLGITPVHATTSCARWPTMAQDFSGDSDMYHSKFYNLSELCIQEHVNPLDILGLAMTAENEMVKNEKSMNPDPNPFDYDEFDAPENRYTHIKSALTSVGFAYTEVVPFDSTPLPDDDSVVMSIVPRYGGSQPRAPIKLDAKEKVAVKTTRYILKRHVHVSPAIHITGRGRKPVINIDGEKYDETCREGLYKVVKEFLRKTENLKRTFTEQEVQ